MITVKFMGKTYAVVPDDVDASPSCAQCVFKNDQRHRCDNEDWDGEQFSDGPAEGCIEGYHHYEELPE
jgi:hypothetical protein